MKKKVIQVLKEVRDINCSLVALLAVTFMRKKENTCILVTNGGNSGAPLVLLEAAIVYKNNGFNPIVIAEHHSKMAQLCKKNGIKMWTIPFLKEKIIKKILEKDIRFALVNTVVMFKWINKLSDTNIPTLWWIHESDTYIVPIRESLPQRIGKNIKVLAVGQRPIESLKRNGIKYNASVMMYGVRDMAVSSHGNRNYQHKVFTILVMGSICKRKNQICAIEAYSKLPQSMKKKIKLIFVGLTLANENDYYISLMNKIKGESNVDYISYVERRNIPELYNSVDAVLCSSIDDPLPVVVTEGLMFGKIVIVSSETGQYSIIRNGVNGFSYNANSIEELTSKYIEAFEQRGKNSIQLEARKTYEDYFSTKTFENNLLKYINEINDGYCKKGDL